ELWGGAEISVPESERAVPGEGEYSHEDLVGCRLFAIKAGSAAESGSAEESRLIGVVRGVEEYGGPPLLQLEAEDGREILVPFVRSICREIDVAAKIIRAELPEGLTEL